MPWKSLTNKSGEVRELTREDLRTFKSAAEVLPPEIVAVLPKKHRGQRGPQKSQTKDQITLRLDRDVVEFFKSSGPGWQTRINRALREAIKETG